MTIASAPSRAPGYDENDLDDGLPMLQRMAALPEDDPEREALRTALILRFLPVAERIAARQAASTPWARDDLLQIGRTALVGAVDRWDPDRAHGDFLGYLVPCVRGEILRFFRDQSWTMRVPRRVKDLHVAIRKVTGPMSQELGRAPRPSELAERLDVDREEIVEALRAEDDHHPMALDAAAEDGQQSVSDRIPQVDGGYELIEDLRSLRPLLERLPAREYRILMLRYYGDRTQTQIAQEIGISQMHVSRLLSQTLARLRRGLLAEAPGDDDPARGP
ncbi:sigma-70 family RNA polymerase sigma factor [Pseudonocardia oroxyli]|uniref:RNA polymerase sigma-B factor n=1 Tax=Pseudonocardia oroxyli TaxID=366584 RepID=A0A1G7XQQ7_PSEOR|nr:sigma-70 family RNA polymerase sigma factor [Pseudonocardia oroxyli]SDG86373.1 RNA polymerase sigma-B factor [Pseudonocardia oroxyli]